MIITKTTIYEIEEHGIILYDPCQASLGENDELILQLFEEANQSIEEPVHFCTIEDYYPLDNVKPNHQK